MTPLRVGVSGAAGRMGRAVCAAVDAAADLQLVAAADPAAAGSELAPATGTDRPALEVVDGVDGLLAAGCEVVVDFTVREVAVATLARCAEAGVHAVAGTTGLGPADLERLGTEYPADGPTGCVVAPNFAIGAVLLIRFAELAAPWFETAEIIELHHDAKRDAPSGTASLTAERMAAARDGSGAGPWGEDPTTDEVLAGARGGEGPAGIHVHSVRLRGLVAHQEVLLGTDGQLLTLRHDSHDRSSFMPGVLLAVRTVPSRPGLTVGLDHLLGL